MRGWLYNIWSYRIVSLRCRRCNAINEQGSRYCWNCKKKI